MDKNIKRLLYVSDLHGSTSVWKKACRLAALQSCDALVVGGDWLGKRLVRYVPLDNGTWLEKEGQSQRNIKNFLEKEKAKALISEKGAYVVDDLDAQYTITEKSVVEAGVRRLNDWLSTELATSHTFALILGLGNDDPVLVEDCLARWTNHPRVTVISEQPSRWQGICLIGFSYIPPSPWHTYRECSEQEIYERLLESLKHCGRSDPVYLLSHAPPYGTSLDIAAEIDPRLEIRRQALLPVEKHVGSKSIRSIIESGRIALGLHGHIHERCGVDSVNGIPVCNPGSQYWTGILQGYLISIYGGMDIRFRRIEAT